jgi:uncharacterized protein
MPAALKLSRYVVASDALSVKKSGFDGRLLFSTRSGALLTIGRSTWTSLDTNMLHELSDGVKNHLKKCKILVDENENEIEQIVNENQSAIDENDILYQVVQPSAWCQLDCSYCGQEHSQRKLSEIHEQEFLARVRQRLSSAPYRELRLGWFGAEPLMGMSIIRRLTKNAHALAQEFGCTYSAKIVTNGVALSSRLAKELCEEHFVGEAEVTLDGLSENHDTLRFTKSGRGSFDRIFANLKSVAKTTDLSLVIRCNVGRTNASSVTSLIEKLAEAGLAESVKFYTSPIHAWGNDAHKTALTSQEYAELEVQWLALQIRLGFNVGLVPARRKIVCMSVHKQAEVLDAYGNTFNCTEVSYVPSYGKPNVYETRVPVSSIKTKSSLKPSLAENLNSFNDNILTGKQDQCANCKMLPVCGGQCPKSWHENMEPCPSAKRNMRDRLNLLFSVAQLPLGAN